MGLTLSWMGGLIGFLIGSRVAAIIGLGEPLGIAFAVPFAGFGLAGWIYSPLPDTNGGFMAGPMNMCWGWSCDD
jgi:hypothetical protein